MILVKHDITIYQPLKIIQIILFICFGFQNISFVRDFGNDVIAYDYLKGKWEKVININFLRCNQIPSHLANLKIDTVTKLQKVEIWKVFTHRTSFLQS